MRSNILLYCIIDMEEIKQIANTEWMTMFDYLTVEKSKHHFFSVTF